MPEPYRAPRSRSSTLGLGILCGLALIVPLARGGVDAPTEGFALLAAAGAAMLATWASPAVPRSAIALAAVTVVIAAQLVPVPPALHLASPAARRTFEMSLGPIGNYPAPRPLTLDLPATCRELGKAVACLAAFLAAWTLSGTKRRKSVVVVALGASAALVSLVVLGAALLGQPLFEPTTPFVNPNHLAGFLNLTMFTQLAMAIRGHGRSRALWALAFSLSAAAAVSTLSRAGLVALLGGLGAFIAVVVSRERHRPTRVAAVGVVCAFGVGLAALLGLAPLLHEYATLHASDPGLKTALWPSGLRMIADFPLLGVGRGAFGTAFPAYRTEPALVTFTHLENEWLQPLIDLGIPAGLVLLGTFAAIVVGAARRRGGLEETGLLVGIAALALQLVFDFSTEILGVSIPLSIAAGLLARGSRVLVVRAWALRATILLFTLVGIGGLTFAHCWRDDGASAIARAPPGRVAARAAVAARLRPADYLPHAAAGARLAQLGACGEALPWLGRAMALGPMVPEPHLLAARCLAAPRLAQQEYRLAFLLGLPGALAEAAERWSTVEDLRNAAPETPDGLLALGTLLEKQRPSAARAVLELDLDQFADARAMLPLGRALAASGEREQGIAVLQRLLGDEPGNDDARVQLATILSELGREREATTELETGLIVHPGSATLGAELSQRMLATRRFSEARRIAEGIAPRTAGEFAIREGLVANALAAQGRLSEAIERARSGASANPDSPFPYVQVARLCADAGRFAEAIEALEHVVSLPGIEPQTYRATIEQYRQRAAEESTRPGPAREGAPATGPLDQDLPAVPEGGI